VTSPSRASPPAPFSVGTVIADKYRIEGMIGSGGMGIVLAAHHMHLGGRVALKVLAPAGTKQEGLVKRFFQEARLASRIQSEHVARVIDVGILPGQLPFIVMEYLEGSDLRGVLKQRGGTLPVEDAIDYTLQAMEAVAEAHNLGIVHRDLKPQNLYFTRRADGSPLIKVLDFGISKALSPSDQDPDGALTHTRGMLGSPLYVSPEQIRSAKHVDVRSDIWSIGVILYEFLTGHPPFRGETMPAVLASVISDTPAPLGPRFRPELEAVVLRCLQKAPNDRYATVGALADELVHFGGPGARLSWERIRGVLARRPLPSGTNEAGAPLAVSVVSGFGPTQATPLPSHDGGESVLELSSLEPLLTFASSHARPAPGFDPVGRPPTPAAGAPPPGASQSYPSQPGVGRSYPSQPNVGQSYPSQPQAAPPHGPPRPPSASSPSQSGVRPPAGATSLAYTPPPYAPPPPSPYVQPSFGLPQAPPPPQSESASPFASSVQTAPHTTAGAWGSSAGPPRPSRRFGTLFFALGGGVLIGTLAASIALYAGRTKKPTAGADPAAGGAVTTAAVHAEPPPRPTVEPAAAAPAPPEAPSTQPAAEVDPTIAQPASSKGGVKKPRDPNARPGGKGGSGPSLESLIDSRR
jgi:serine/threonine protein kinase